MWAEAKDLKKTAMFCPSFQGQYYGHSYTPNNSGHVHWGWSSGSLQRLRAKIVNPSHKISFAESPGWECFDNGYDSYYFTYFEHRHNDSMNLLYFDGHVDPTHGRLPAMKWDNTDPVWPIF